jgi:hypothetical protein
MLLIRSYQTHPLWQDLARTFYFSTSSGCVQWALPGFTVDCQQVRKLPKALSASVEPERKHGRYSVAAIAESRRARELIRETKAAERRARKEFRDLKTELRRLGFLRAVQPIIDEVVGIERLESIRSEHTVSSRRRVDPHGCPGAGYIRYDPQEHRQGDGEDEYLAVSAFAPSTRVTSFPTRPSFTRSPGCRTSNCR